MPGADVGVDAGVALGADVGVDGGVALGADVGVGAGVGDGAGAATANVAAESVHLYSVAQSVE